jgi:hypothetical protein
MFGLSFGAKKSSQTTTSNVDKTETQNQTQSGTQAQTGTTTNTGSTTSQQAARLRVRLRINRRRLASSQPSRNRRRFPRRSSVRWNNRLRLCWAASPVRQASWTPDSIRPTLSRRESRQPSRKSPISWTHRSTRFSTRLVAATIRIQWRLCSQPRRVRKLVHRWPEPKRIWKRRPTIFSARTFRLISPASRLTMRFSMRCSEHSKGATSTTGATKTAENTAATGTTAQQQAQTGTQATQNTQVQDLMTAISQILSGTTHTVGSETDKTKGSSMGGGFSLGF